MTNNKMIKNKLESINRANINIEKILKLCVYLNSILPDIINKIKEILEAE